MPEVTTLDAPSRVLLTAVLTGSHETVRAPSWLTESFCSHSWRGATSTSLVASVWGGWIGRGILELYK